MHTTWKWGPVGPCCDPFQQEQHRPLLSPLARVFGQSPARRALARHVHLPSQTPTRPPTPFRHLRRRPRGPGRRAPGGARTAAGV